MDRSGVLARGGRVLLGGTECAGRHPHTLGEEAREICRIVEAQKIADLGHVQRAEDEETLGFDQQALVQDRRGRPSAARFAGQSQPLRLRSASACPGRAFIMVWPVPIRG